LIDELNAFFKTVKKENEEENSNKLLKDEEFVKKILSPWTAARFLTLPDFT